MIDDFKTLNLVNLALPPWCGSPVGVGALPHYCEAIFRVCNTGCHDMLLAATAHFDVPIDQMMEHTV